jgi:hypothetical protein
LLPSWTMFVSELARALRCALANSCAIFVFTCSFRVPGVVALAPSHKSGKCMQCCC